MADFRYPFPLQKHLFNRGLVASKNYAPLIDDIHFQVATISSTNAILQGDIGEISGVIDAAPVSSGTNASLQGSIGEISNSFVANTATNTILQGDVGEISSALIAITSTSALLQGDLGDISGNIAASSSTNVSLFGDVGDINGFISTTTPELNVVSQGLLDDISGQLQATVTTSLLLGSDIGSLTGNINTSISTNIALGGKLEDISGGISSDILSPIISLGGVLDDISGILDATVVNEAPVSDKDKGISGKKHVNYVKGKKDKEVLKLRPEKIDQQVYNLLFNEAKEVLKDAKVKTSSIDILADSVVSDVLDKFNTSQVASERERVLEEARLNAYLVAIEYLNRLRREDEDLLLLL
jgi:hypothetical protein